METLFEHQENLLANVSDSFYRSLYYKLNWDQRMLGIIGLRGAGKTTMLLQYLKYSIGNRKKALYVTADHPWFYDHRLFELANQFVKYGGEILLVDEVHKHAEWSRELKTIYDAHKDLRVIFTASSALDVLKGEHDLSRRVVIHELTGLSFREYLSLFHQLEFPQVALEDIFREPSSIIERVMTEVKPLPLFRDYLKTGYFPFSIDEPMESFQIKLNQILNLVLETDLQIIENYSASNIFKIKQLLGVIAESAPFEPNISKMARKMEIGRDSVKAYLYNLHKARILNLIQRDATGVSALQKPDKIYLENSNLSYALKRDAEVGTIRETFFLNQIRNAGSDIKLSKKGDFLIDDRWTVEIGGSGKSNRQIQHVENAFRALDDTERSYLNVIPLWVFGFLY
jgi:predicted AAA+ superfamily ATPase